MPGVEKMKKKETEPVEPVDTHNEWVCTQVLNSLGKPPQFSRILATWINRNRYRVNVRAYKEEWGEQLTDSFWVETDNGGKVVKTNPAMTRKY